VSPFSTDQLCVALLTAKDAAGASLITQAEAKNRADAIRDWMVSTRFHLKLLGWPSPFGGLYPAYEINDPRYDLDSFDFGASDTFAVNAPGISHGDLLKLGRVLETKQRLLPGRWPKSLLDGLKDPQKHLDTVEELCWLDRWQDVQSVSGPVINSITGQDADWSLTSRDHSLVIEIKNWRGEWTGILDNAHKGRSHESRFASLNGKFNARGSGVLNIGCISTFFPADTELEATARSFLKAHQEIDAIVIHSGHAQGVGTHIDVFGEEQIRDNIRALLKPLPREELRRAVVVEHLARDPNGGLIRSVDDYLKFNGLI
jgi:hypothetical protein